MIREQIKKRQLPDALIFKNGEAVKNREQWQQRREEIKEMLCTEEYGFFPPAPKNVKAEILSNDARFCAGKAPLTKVLLTVEMEDSSFSFPIYCVIPAAGHPLPAFLYMNFSDAVPDRYLPSEEICDNGFAVISFFYQDVTTDDGDFSNGLAGEIYQGKERDATSPGKIALWAWAAMRVMDYMQTLEGIDKKNIAVAGHSRLGKTALLTGAFDERFAFSISNDSGCSGAAITRGKRGETVKNICGTFPHWFCKNYQKYMGREHEMPFDQHFLLSLIAPRKLYVASAEQDIWADPDSEFLSCAAADGMFKLLGEAGIICPDRMPQTNDTFQEGTIGYHMRAGIHYASRYDWQRYMEFMTAHKNK